MGAHGAAGEIGYCLKHAQSGFGEGPGQTSQAHPPALIWTMPRAFGEPVTPLCQPAAEVDRGRPDLGIGVCILFRWVHHELNPTIGEGTEPAPATVAS
jgi:hypothetical protein